MENDDSMTVDIWKRFLAMQYADLFGVVAETGLRYFEKFEQLTSDGSNHLDEPIDMLAVVGLDYVNGLERCELEEIMAQERNLFAMGGLAAGNRAVAYALVDDEIRLYPTPPTGQTYELLYVYQPPDLSLMDDAELIDVVTPDGEAFMIWGACVRALAKQDKDPSLHRVEREEARERVRSWAIDRAFNSPRRYVTESPWGRYRLPGDWDY